MITCTAHFYFGSHYGQLIIPQEVIDQLGVAKGDRMVIDIPGVPRQHLQLHRDLSGYLIYLSNRQAKALKPLELLDGDEVLISIGPDTTKYQAPEPEEWMELLNQEPEVAAVFEAMTPGQQRGVLFLVDGLKSPEARMRKSLRIAEHLLMGRVKPNEFGR